MALGKIGDINHDGYNDLAVSAPFEDGGVVYIYLGSSEGLSEHSSQKIRPLGNLSVAFGFSISRGVDIDGNGYRDIAIGAPESNEVHIFKTYPTIKVKASLELTSKDGLEKSTQISFEFCAQIEASPKVTHGIGKINYFQLYFNLI